MRAAQSEGAGPGNHRDQPDNDVGGASHRSGDVVRDLEEHRFSLWSTRVSGHSRSLHAIVDSRDRIELPRTARIPQPYPDVSQDQDFCFSGRAGRPRNLTALSAPLSAQNGLWSRLPRIWAEHPCSAEQKWSFLTLFIPLSTDLPPNAPPQKSHSQPQPLCALRPLDRLRTTLDRATPRDF